MEWQQSRNSSHDDEDEEDPEVEYDEDTKLKFFDYQSALRTDLLNESKGGVEKKSMSKSMSIRLQKIAEKVWLDET